MSNSTTRRHFIKSAATAALGAPFLLDAASVNARPLSANDRITIGCIGLGIQGRNLMNGFMNRQDTQILAVCDVDTTRREHHQKMVNDHYEKPNACAAYKDFHELLDRKDIDAVVIATPDHWHAYIAIAACKAGKDVYCEKPLSLTIHEARQMVKAARKHDRVFQTGSMQRSMKEFTKACELVRNDCIGKIKQVIIDVGDPSVPCDLPEETMEPGLNWDMWLGPAPKRAYNSILSPRGVNNFYPNWRKYREFSGGGMTDFGAHHFDIAQWGLGMDDSGPIEIIPPEDPNAVRGLRYIYANGVEMIHGNNYDHHGGILFIGEKGQIHVDRGLFKSTPEDLVDFDRSNLPIHLYKSQNHITDFLKCMRSRQKPVCDVEIGCRTATVCHLGNLAYWNHRRLIWDPSNERFVGDREANHWLDRTKRGPWKV